MSGIDPSRIISTEPALVRRSEAPLKLWGDPEAGWVNDWIYASSARIFSIVFSLPPDGGFEHSQTNRTIFGGDELFHVLQGTLVLANPQMGDVLRLETGDSAWFRPDTWHHGFNAGGDEVRVLEYFAPPPAAGMSQAYARTKPYLQDAVYRRGRLQGRWPGVSRSEAAEGSIHRVRRDEILWRLEGDEHQLPVGILLSTPELTVGCLELRAGQRSGTRVHPGDLSVYVLEGRLNILVRPGDGPRTWHALDPDDGFFVPEGTRYELRNVSGGATRAMFGVAPRYDGAAPEPRTGPTPG